MTYIGGGNSIADYKYLFNILFSNYSSEQSISIIPIVFISKRDEDNRNDRNRLFLLSSSLLVLFSLNLVVSGLVVVGLLSVLHSNIHFRSIYCIVISLYCIHLVFLFLLLVSQTLFILLFIFTIFSIFLYFTV